MLVSSDLLTQLLNPLFFQVRTIVTETAFSIDELEELYLLFKVSDSHTVANRNLKDLISSCIFLSLPFSLAGRLISPSSHMVPCYHGNAELWAIIGAGT